MKRLMLVAYGRLGGGCHTSYSVLFSSVEPASTYWSWID